MSAIIGQDWRPKTLRELVIQWQAYQLDRWQHTAQLTRIHCDKKVKYEDVHPYIKRGSASSTTRYTVKPKPLFTTVLEESSEQQFFREMFGDG